MLIGFGVLEAALNNGDGMAKATKKKMRKRVLWTKGDIRQLKSLAKQKVGVAKIAKALKRTTGATVVKASKLGVSLDSRS